MIPIEIVDRILSSLHSDQDYTSLKSCSVVFPLLVDRHLYSQITFYVSGGVLDSEASSFDPDDTYVVDSTIFSRTLFDQPPVLNCVRDVRIVLVALRPLEPKHFQVISGILSTLARIESLTLTTVGCPIGSNGRIPWPTLGPEFCAAFQNSLRLPSIRKAAISNFNHFPLNFFEDCKTLTHLHLHELDFVNGGDISPSLYPRLSSLNVGGRSCDWARAIPTTTLHTLSLCTHSRFDFPKIRILIAACSASLVNLELNCGHYMGNPFEVTHLDHPQLRLPLLEHIIFRCNITERGAFSCLNLFIPFLTTISSISPTSPIRLTLHISYFAATPTPDWSNITKILVLSIFRHPIELHITHQKSWCTPELEGLRVDSLERHDIIKELLVDGKLVLIKKKASYGSEIYISYPDEDP